MRTTKCIFLYIKAMKKVIIYNKLSGQILLFICYKLFFTWKKMLKYFLSSHLWLCCYMALTAGLTIFTPCNKRKDGLLISVLLLKYMFSGQTFNFEALENTLEWLSSVCGRGEMEREETYGISLPSYVAYFFSNKDAWCFVC